MITVDMDKARAVAHRIRRQQRAAEFAPHDEVIALRIPGAAGDAAEAARAEIRQRYVLAQEQIDAATGPEALSEIVKGLSKTG